MAYETGGASSVADLIDKLRIFAAANGWTVNFNGARTDGTTGVVVLLSRSGVCIGFATNTAAGSPGDPGPRVVTFHYPGPYSSGSNPMTQTDASGQCESNNMPGPFQAYHFFASGTYLHAVAEVSPGSFRHFGAGALSAAGSLTSGLYAYGTHWNYSTFRVDSSTDNDHYVPFDDAGTQTSGRGTIIRADSDSLSPRYIRLNDSSGSGWGGFRRASNQTRIMSQLSGLSRIGPSALTGRNILLPLFCGVHRPGGNFSLIGAPFDLRYVSMDNLVPGAVVTLGADDWKCFPVIRKNGVTGQENSANFGYAYRVVP